MKYCLSSRQPKSLLRKADEIKIMFNDMDILYDYIEDMPDKTYILDIPRDKTLANDFSVYQAFADKVNFMCCLHDLRAAELFAAAGLKWYWAYPITTYYELQGILALKPCYLYLTAPLTMDLLTVSKLAGDIPLRMVPNLAYDAYIPRENGICGQWVRPEDTDAYNYYISTFEFITTELSKEATLFHVYAENQNWPGNLNLLITNLDYDIDNRTIPEEIIDVRMHCRQRCMSGGRCHLCENAFNCMSTLRHKFYESRKKDRHIQPEEE